MATNNASVSQVSWNPVIAGTVLACAVTLILVPFGQGLGLSFTEFNSDEAVTPHSLLAFGLWALWVQLSASIVGGYTAGRLLTTSSGYDSEMRDGVHGLLAWALSSLVIALVVGLAGALAAIAAANGAEPAESAQAAAGLSDATAKKVALIAGFSLAATSLVSATVAWFMGTVGGDHRDRKTDVIKMISFRSR